MLPSPRQLRGWETVNKWSREEAGDGRSSAPEAGNFVSRRYCFLYPKAAELEPAARRGQVDVRAPQ